MRLKRHAMLGHLAQIRQAHHLKPAAIRQNRLFPIHELMQTTKAVNAFRRRSQHQMIRIAQQNISAGGSHTLRHHRLHSGSGANRHKRRRTDIATRRGNHTSTGFPVSGMQVKCNTLCHKALVPDFEKK